MPTKGLYDPSLERDACGVGFIVNIDGKFCHKIVDDARIMTVRMNHRGACSCDNDTGDGAGILTCIPHALYECQLKNVGVDLPGTGYYATGIIFTDQASFEEGKKCLDNIAPGCKIQVLCWRNVPVDSSCLGKVAKESQPDIKQVFVIPKEEMDQDCFNRNVFSLRKQLTHRIGKLGLRFYICSLSTNTVVYKGQLTGDQLFNYFEDLKDPLYETYLALVHTRFSTNTFPSWEKAQPLRYLAHNGEINTLRGNVNLMKAREGLMQSTYFNKDLKLLYPVVEEDLSDSGCLDCVLEWLMMAGDRSLPEAAMTMIPEAWENNELMDSKKREFYKFVSCNMESWDGPALLTFSDGRYIGAILDRNGLRPSRYYITSDNVMIMASEVGIYDVEPSKVLKKGRLKPGRMLLVDTKEKVITKDEELKVNIASSRPHSEWLKNLVSLSELRKQKRNVVPSKPIENGIINDEDGNIKTALSRDPRLTVFGYTLETVTLLLMPMITTTKEGLGSMGNDAPLACLSQYQPLIYDYFKQLFAQVTNPPIDPFREKIIMSLSCAVGPTGNFLQPSAEDCKRLLLDNPILSKDDMDLIKNCHYHNWKVAEIKITYSAEDGKLGLKPALERLCQDSCRAAEEGASFLVLTDKYVSESRIPVSSLLAVGAVHHALIETRNRSKVALFVETGEAREVHHMCLLLGYGADGIYPYLVFETMNFLRDQAVISCNLDNESMFANYTASVDVGVSKVMAKMGISTLRSYKGAQIFEAVGLSSEVIDLCFKNTRSLLGGLGFAELAEDSLDRHFLAYNGQCDSYILRNPGNYHWRHGGEKHLNEPTSIAHLQVAAKQNSKSSYEEFRKSTLESVKECTLRGQVEIVESDKPVDLDEVEPASEIVKRFCTGAMSFGSISLETHTTIAIAMNRLGSKSNTGEGGESSVRYIDQDPQFNKRSAIKQVASGRFGVSAEYLANADEIQIKMAQGAKPGEGGELPGHKVSVEIAATRNSVPGVGLISPPPHHDIYSIEDLAQLIYDLKCANPMARISVKLVSEMGVGVIAAGVAKGRAEHMTVSGHDGGTGASSWTGIKHAGLPWELGLAETHEVLVRNDLRSRVVLQVDGQIRTGFDVVVGACLGADEFGFSTAPLITLGCIMMRKCHLNTCPVGVATQDPELRKKFDGAPENLINYMFFIANDVRELMAKIGVRKFKDLVGRRQFLSPRADIPPRIKLLDFGPILYNVNKDYSHYNLEGGTVKQDFDLNSRLEEKLLKGVFDVLDDKCKSLYITADISNSDRAFGSTMSYHIVKRRISNPLPDNTINIQLRGSAGQSLGAFLINGITITVEGDANDYVGKGLSGGQIIIYPTKILPSDFKSSENVIAGNVCLYGAIRGKAFIRGAVAERFCVRNSGAIAVVEAIGDHGCEYMTGGVAVILGPTGRNFAAGMSGGIAYVYDPHGRFPSYCNQEMVELLPLERKDDLEIVYNLVTEFESKTGSDVAHGILKTWKQTQKYFVKVFPYDYQKALKQNQENAALAIQKNLKKSENDHMVKDIEDIVTDEDMLKKKIESIDKSRGFMKYSRETEHYRKPTARLGDWKEIYDFPRIRGTLRVQAARCMECGVPFCQSNSYGCPLGNIIPKWNDLVFNENWKEALAQLLQTNNFPEFTGRVCPAPCEGACVLGINSSPVTIKNIECSIIDNGFENGWITPQIPTLRTGKKVAIVGSGPAGLACAAQLNKAGHTVMVYERNDRIGGLLQYGIPSMKLDKNIVQRRIDVMQKEGITFFVNAFVGKNITASELVETSDAVVLCCGATWPRDLDIPGRQLEGIHFAVSFLENWQKNILGRKMDPELMDVAGKDVVIIGGGDTGNDCIGTSIRLSAKSITTFEILPEPPASRSPDNPWPLYPKVFKVDYGHQEVACKFGRDPRQFSTLSKEFVGDDKGHVSGIRTVQVDWTRDDSGRWKMQEMPGTEKVYKADIVILAMGFLGPENAIIDSLSLEKDNRSNISTNNKYFTGTAKVFAAGDCRRGQSLVVWAITEGRQAAREVDVYLQGFSTLPGPGGVQLCRERP